MSAMQTFDWAVISTEGLPLLTGLSEGEARQIAASGAYPPAGDTPGRCYAVPERVAKTAHDVWQACEQEFEFRKRRARQGRVADLLIAYDVAFQGSDAVLPAF